MTTLTTIDDKTGAIRSSFSAVIGAKLVCYETAELLLDNGTWTAWPDLPIRLHTDRGIIIAIVWSDCNDLWIAMDSSLPFSFEGSTVRWVRNSIEKVNAALDSTIRAVKIGRGEMSIEGRDVEIWTRLLIEVGNGWLEIFIALDENGYDFHVRSPTGDFIPCI